MVVFILLIALGVAIISIFVFWRIRENTLCTKHWWQLVEVSFASLLDITGENTKAWRYRWQRSYRACPECMARFEKWRTKTHGSV